MTITVRTLAALLAATLASVAGAERVLFRDVTLDLVGALPGGAQAKDLQLYLGWRAEGADATARWRTHVLGWANQRRDGSGAYVDKATYFNAMDHDGTLTAVEEDAARVVLTITMAINPDPWVAGGPATYRIELQREGDRFAGRFSGTFRDQPAQGAVVGSLRAKPWPAALPGRAAAAPGEHPRLLFRAADLPRLRERAQTPEGQAILARLRLLLGKDGEGFPDVHQQATQAYGGGSGDLPIGAYTLAHGVGYGFLHQLTGEQRYADLARQAVDLARSGVRDRDQRYAWHRPGGKLRAGNSYAMIATAYDLCYHAWPEEYRTQLAREIQDKISRPAASTPAGGDDVVAKDLVDQVKGTEDELALKEPVHTDLVFNTVGGQHAAFSNHYGAWNGGGGTALLAILGDPGTNEAVTQRAHRIFLQRAKRCLEVGFGHSGWFYEGHHGGRLSLNTGFFGYLNALCSAEGLDLVADCPEAEWLLTKHLYELVRTGDRLATPERGIYAHPFWERNGQSSGGDFAHGFGLVPERALPAVRWFYEQVVCPQAEKDYDALTWPHRAVDAFLHWPIGVAARNPAEVLPRYLPDAKAGYLVVRSGWSGGEDDLMVALIGGQGIVIGMGQRQTLTIDALPIGAVRDIEQGQAAVFDSDGTALIADASGASGAPILLVTARGLARAPAAAGGAGGVDDELRRRFGGQRKKQEPGLGGRFAEGPAAVAADAVAVSRQKASFAGCSLELVTIQRGQAPKAAVEEHAGQPRVRIGGRTIALDAEGRLVVGRVE